MSRRTKGVLVLTVVALAVAGPLVQPSIPVLIWLDHMLLLTVFVIWTLGEGTPAKA